MHESELDLSAAPAYSLESTETLVKEFDRHVAEARTALDAKDDDYRKTWSLKSGDRVFFTQPRVDVVRQTINHLVHHRGQLSVYLRLVDVPLPSIYGPTADERW